MSASRSSSRRRRGAAAIIVVVLLLIMNLIILTLVLGGARDLDLSLQRLDTVRSFYAAEGGMNMAIRELMVDADDDGDGTIGSISDDADDNTDPTIGVARVVVTIVPAPSQATLTSSGRSGQAKRDIQTRIN